MKNVEMKMVSKDTLEIKVDLSKSFGVSTSGKSNVIATTEGNQAVVGAENIKVGLNIYTPVNSKAKLEGAVNPVLGTNVTGSVKGNILTLKVNTTQKHGVSKSGKSETVATTNGNIAVGIGDVKIGLNVYTPVGK